MGSLVNNTPSKAVIILGMNLASAKLIWHVVIGTEKPVIILGMDLAGAEWDIDQTPTVKFGRRQIFRKSIILSFMKLALDFDW